MRMLEARLASMYEAMRLACQGARPPRGVDARTDLMRSSLSPGRSNSAACSMQARAAVTSLSMAAFASARSFMRLSVHAFRAVTIGAAVEADVYMTVDILISLLALQTGWPAWQPRSVISLQTASAWTCSSAIQRLRLAARAAGFCGWLLVLDSSTRSMNARDLNGRN